MTPAGRRWEALGTTVDVSVTDPSSLDRAYAIADRRIALVGDACDRSRPDSELSALTGRAERGVRISPVLADLVAVALGAAAGSDGVVDPTVGVGPDGAARDGRLRLVVDGGAPTPGDSGAAARWTTVRLEDDVLVVPVGVALDLDAAARARTADAIVATAAASLGCGVLVRIGAHIASRGGAPDGGWPITVAARAGDPGCRIALPADGALVTVHLPVAIHPRTRRSPVPVWRTVSVLADTAVRAGTLAAAAILDGSQALHRLDVARFPARLVDVAGGVTHVHGWPEEAQRAA